MHHIAPKRKEKSHSQTSQAQQVEPSEQKYRQFKKQKRQYPLYTLMFNQPAHTNTGNTYVAAKQMIKALLREPPCASLKNRIQNGTNQVPN